MKKSASATGYGKPPSAHQFTPGKSGNPKGRPPGVKNLATDLAEELSEKVQITEGGKPKKISKQRAVIKALMIKALKGDARAASTVLGLVPAVEQARLATEAAETLSASDKEILQAFRKQVVEEMTQQTPGDDE